MSADTLAVSPVPQSKSDAFGPADPRIKAFCSADGAEVFHSIAHAHDVWRPDPFDVEIIHADARATFQRLLHRATAAPAPTSGRILLLLGESGSGKTHLMRAFRNAVHQKGLGYCGYLQMTTATNNYARYVLRNLIDSLDRVYCEDEGDLTGLMRLANSLAEAPHAALPSGLAMLREEEAEGASLTQLVHTVADLIVQDGPFRHFDLDLIRAFLYLQRDDPRIKGRVLRYLRCEDLAEHDRQVLGGMVPRSDEADPLRAIEFLGRLMGTVRSEALVICIDQMEEMYNLEQAEEKFRRVIGTVCAIADQVPNAVLVVSCLEDFYQKLKGHLTRPVVDRLERDPEPMRLNGQRTEDEIHQLVGRRLQHFYDSLDVAFEETEPAFPIAPAMLRKLTNLRTRDVIDWCREYRNRCIAAGRLVADGDVLAIRSDSPPQPLQPLLDLSQLWNDFRSEFQVAVSEKEEDLAALLGWAITACSDETTAGHSFAAADVAGRFIEAMVQGPDNNVRKMKIGVCNKAAQGGALARQIKELEQKAGEHPPVIVRSTDFPKGARAAVCKQIGDLIARGGRRAVVEDSEWRVMLALQAFRRAHESRPGFAAWLKEEQPLSGLQSLRIILDLDQFEELPRKPLLPEPPAATAEAAKPGKSQPASPATETAPSDLLRVGISGGLSPETVALDPRDLVYHTAFLGGTGSGKTTVALNLIEQLLLRGVPAVLLDRKGDLCGYARPEVWSQPLPDAALEKRRQLLRERVKGAVYTPGNAGGRGLSIPLVPEGLEQMSSADRNQMAGYAAFALGGMMNYKDKGLDASRLAVLRQAILLLGTAEPPRPVTIDALIEIIHAREPALLNAIGKLDPKLFDRLVQDLETLRLHKGDLLSSGGERLDTAALLGLGPHAVPGKTRLSIISTKFLGDNASIEFWVAQLLMEVGRWASKHPSSSLQAVFLFDEADMYLPAQRKPATKEPMENLLKRARSAGIGVFLASQSPGDFDYKCRDNIRTWLLGRITQTTSLAKMKPLLSDCRDDKIAARLPAQQIGHFHLVREGAAKPFHADRSFLKTEQLSEEEILRLARPKITVGH